MKRIDLQKMFHGKQFIEHVKDVSRETFAHKMEVIKIKKGFWKQDCEFVEIRMTSEDCSLGI